MKPRINLKRDLMNFAVVNALVVPLVAVVLVVRVVVA